VNYKERQSELIDAIAEPVVTLFPEEIVEAGATVVRTVPPLDLWLFVQCNRSLRWAIMRETGSKLVRSFSTKAEAMEWWTQRRSTCEAVEVRLVRVRPNGGFV